MKVIPRLFREFRENKVIVAIYHQGVLYYVKRDSFTGKVRKGWRESPAHAGRRLLEQHFPGLVNEEDVLASRVPSLGYRHFFAAWVIPPQWPIELFSTNLRKNGMLIKAVDLMRHESRRHQNTTKFILRMIKEHRTQSVAA